MQRANDELQEEVDTLRKQATFLHNRFGGGVGTSGNFHYHRSLTRHHMSLIDDAVELSDDDDDDSSVDLGFDYVLQQQQPNNDDDYTTTNNAIATSTSSPPGSS